MRDRGGFILEGPAYRNDRTLEELCEANHATIERAITFDRQQGKRWAHHAKRNQTKCYQCAHCDQIFYVIPQEVKSA